MTLGQAALRVERRDDVDALAAGQQRKGFEAEVGKQRPKPQRGLLHALEIEADIGIEVEHQAVGIFDLGDLAAPAVEFDRPHLHAGEQPADVVEIEIILDRAVLFLDRDMLDRVAERAAVMLLEEAFLAPPLRAADQGHRPLGGIDHDQGIDRRIIIGEVALGQLLLGKDGAVGVGDANAEAGEGRQPITPSSDGFRCLGVSRTTSLAGLSSRSAMKLGWRRIPSLGEFGEGDFRDQLRLDEMASPAVGARNVDRRLVDLQRLHPVEQVGDLRRVESGPDLARIGELPAVARGEEQRAEALALVAFGPADDDEFLALDALDLEPAAAALARNMRRRPSWR